MMSNEVGKARLQRHAYYDLVSYILTHTHPTLEKHTHTYILTDVFCMNVENGWSYTRIFTCL